MAVPSEWLQAAPAQQPVQEAGKSLNRGLSDIPRQIGLTARYALEGPAQAAQIFTEPVAGLTRGAHADLMRAVHPHQQVLVLPGAAYGQDPTPFIAYAHGNPQVWGVIPFIWAHVPESADKEGWIGLEKQPTEAQERYRRAGLVALNKKEAQ